MYGHVEKLAEEIKKGAASVEGVEAKLWQVCASLSDQFSVLKSINQIITPIKFGMKRTSFLNIYCSGETLIL